MKNISLKYTVLIGLFGYLNVAAISVVYNYRIAQVTKQPIFEEFHNKNTIVALLFDQYQKKYTGDIRQNFVGGLGAYIYEFSSYYFRADFAVSHINETVSHATTFSGTKTDDILFSFGGHIIESDRTPLALSGLFGIPTHHIFTLKHIDFGYGQVSLGTQLDGTYKFKHQGTFVYGMRYIYFFARHAHDTTGESYRFSIGQDVDFLFAYKNNWNHHGFECGLTERFQFKAHISPHLDDIIQQTDYRRTNFYAVYKYKFLVNNIPNRVLFNIGYGFDTSPKEFGNKNIILCWAAWNINF